MHIAQKPIKYKLLNIQTSIKYVLLHFENINKLLNNKKYYTVNKLNLLIRYPPYTS